MPKKNTSVLLDKQSREYGFLSVEPHEDGRHIWVHNIGWSFLVDQCVECPKKTVVGDVYSAALMQGKAPHSSPCRAMDNVFYTTSKHCPLTCGIMLDMKSEKKPYTAYTAYWAVECLDPMCLLAIVRDREATAFSINLQTLAATVHKPVIMALK